MPKPRQYKAITEDIITEISSVFSSSFKSIKEAQVLSCEKALITNAWDSDD